jgi:formylglycine-generating enzyme required for sulfatase activity
LIGTLRDPQQPAAARIRAGFELGAQADPRFPVSLSEWRDELAWLVMLKSDGYFCYVPAGTYNIGSRDNDPYAHSTEQPLYSITLERPFWIGRYLITNAQWQAWVRAGGVPSAYTDHAPFNQPNQPVVGVSWQACYDFCGWLGQALYVPILLPSEAEWEAAARGLRGSRYTWGHRWYADRAASRDDQETRGTPATVPVGCYPLGAAPCGALDMLGNVWEWTASPWTSDHAPRQSIQRSHDARQLTVKGGSYRTRPPQIRCAARSPASRDARDPDLGFRIILDADKPPHP